MFKILSKKKSKDRMVVVDLGTQYIKVIDLTVKKGQATLHDFRILNLIKGGRRFVAKEISKILKKSILDMGVSEKYVLSSLSGKSVLVRIMDLPKMSAKELKSSLKYQTDLHLPFKLDDAHYDCLVLDDQDVPEGRMKVIVAAAPRKEGAKVIEIIRGAGLVPKKIDVDAVALSNAFQWGNTKKEENPVALVNIGASRTNLTIVHQGLPRLCRELNHGGIAFTEAIVAGTDVTFDEAEEKKIMGDESVMTHLEEAMKPLISGLLQSFDFHEGSSGGHISKVYLSGGSALIRGIMDYLKEGLDRTVLIWDPLRGIDIEALSEREGELLQSNSPLLTIAMGIALGESETTHDKN